MRQRLLGPWRILWVRGLPSPFRAQRRRLVPFTFAPYGRALSILPCRPVLAARLRRPQRTLASLLNKLEVRVRQRPRDRELQSSSQGGGAHFDFNSDVSLTSIQILFQLSSAIGILGNIAPPLWQFWILWPLSEF